MRNMSGKESSVNSKNHRAARKPNVSLEEILSVMRELYAQHQVVTRDALITATGHKLHILDDHLKRLVEQGLASRLRSGVYVPVIEWGDPRAVTVTHLHGGMSTIEIGDEVLQLQPAERRLLASLLVGDAVQYSNMQAGHEANLLANELYTAMKMLRRQDTNSSNSALPKLSPAASHLAERFAEEGQSQV